MIYAFLSDEAFAGVGGGALLSHADIGKSNLGVLNDQMANYFLNPATLVDPRSVSSKNDRLASTPFGQRAYGGMYLHFDNTHKGDGNDYTHIRPSYMEQDDYEAMKYLGESKDVTTTGDARSNLFNIIEYCFIQHRNDKEALLSPEEIDKALLEQKGSTFTGYVAGSIKVSAGTSNSKIRLSTTNDQRGYEMYTTEIPFYHWVQFDFNVNNKKITFKIWLGMQAFLDDYPLFHLVRVVWPCDPARLLDMDFANTVTAIVESSGFKDEQLDKAIHEEDHSGLATYVSRYVNSSLATYYRMPFTVLYKGCVPTSSAMRDFVREELLDQGLADEEVWKQVLPDLFVDGGFYLVPFYEYRVELTDGYVIDKNIVDYDKMTQKLIELFPNISSEWFRDHGSLLMAAGSGLYIYAFPLEDNTEDFLDFTKLHPTYQNVDANNPYWDLMDEDTQEFAEELSIALKVALALQNNDNNMFTEEQINHKNYLAFIADFIEFHLLKKDSY